MDLREIAEYVVENKLQVPLEKEIQLYSKEEAKRMIAAGCSQAELRDKFGHALGQECWKKYKK